MAKTLADFRASSEKQRAARLEKNGLKLDLEDPKAMHERLRMGMRVDEVRAVAPGVAWALLSGRNPDGSVYRVSDCWIQVDDVWVERPAPAAEDLARLPKGWPPPVDDFTHAVEREAASVLIAGSAIRVGERRRRQRLLPFGPLNLGPVPFARPRAKEGRIAWRPTRRRRRPIRRSSERSSSRPRRTRRCRPTRWGPRRSRRWGSVRHPRSSPRGSWRSCSPRRGSRRPIVGALTLGLADVVIWNLRLANKNRRVAGIVREAETPEGRKEAISQLEADADKGDSAAIFAKAQLQMQEDPRAALATLEKVNLQKVMAPTADEARAQRAMIHLLLGETDAARGLVDGIDLTFARAYKEAKQKAMLAAIVGEAQARTGSAKKAVELLETFDPEDEAFADLKPQLLRARAFAYAWANNTKQMKQVLRRLSAMNPQYLAGFITNKKHPGGAAAAASTRSSRKRRSRW